MRLLAILTGEYNVAIGSGGASEQDHWQPQHSHRDTEALQQNDANFNLGKRTSTLLLVCHIR